MIDRNIKPDQREDKAKAQRQIGDWMERDLANVLKKRLKYKAVVIAKDSEFQAGPSNYLLKIKIVKYNPGSHAARAFVGFGAGAGTKALGKKIEEYTGTRPHKVASPVAAVAVPALLANWLAPETVETIRGLA